MTDNDREQLYRELFTERYGRPPGRKEPRRDAAEPARAGGVARTQEGNDRGR